MAINQRGIVVALILVFRVVFVIIEIIDRRNMSKEGETVMGVPAYYTGHNPYQAGIVPPNAIYGDPLGAPIHQTFYRDTPAPFNCLYCGNTGLTNLRSKPGVAAVVACMMPFFLGFCFLCPSMDCLWNKQHHCPQCGNKVADFDKSDPCLVMDPPQWKQPSFALPA